MIRDIELVLRNAVENVESTEHGCEVGSDEWLEEVYTEFLEDDPAGEYVPARYLVDDPDEWFWNRGVELAPIFAREMHDAI